MCGRDPRDPSCFFWRIRINGVLWSEVCLGIQPKHSSVDTGDLTVDTAPWKEYFVKFDVTEFSSWALCL